MIICGIKLTHDAAFALVDDGVLVLSYEVEKLDNNRRHSDFKLTLSDVDRLMHQYGYRLRGIDQLVVDGWGHEPDPRTEELPGYRVTVSITDEEDSVLDLAPYGHVLNAEDVLERAAFSPEDAIASFHTFPTAAAP